MVAWAWAHLSQARAQSEMLAIFSSQWENGLVPSVRFSPGYDSPYLGGTLLPGPGGWGGPSMVGERGNIGRARGNRISYNTSGLAALPLHAETTLQIFELSLRDSEARLWLQRIFPHLYRYHLYLHKSRGDPDTGLVYVYHPWETEVPPDSIIWSELLRETRWMCGGGRVPAWASFGTHTCLYLSTLYYWGHSRSFALEETHACTF
ncbi:unnamed protein product [Choristocarpus tenellus]